jgi:hypothetical protein
MSTISDSTAAAYSGANVRSELATNAIRDANDQERSVAQRLEEASATDQEEDRSQRKIPGMGQAVDITA